MVNVPHRDPHGRYLHYCMEPGCTAWGAFGFKKGLLWFCGDHRKNFKEESAVAVTARPVGQGRLL